MDLLYWAALHRLVTRSIDLMVQFSYWTQLNANSAGHDEQLRTSGPLLIYLLILVRSTGLLGMIMICKNARQAPRAASQEPWMCDVIALPGLKFCKQPCLGRFIRGLFGLLPLLEAKGNPGASRKEYWYCKQHIKNPFQMGPLFSNWLGPTATSAPPWMMMMMMTTTIRRRKKVWDGRGQSHRGSGDGSPPAVWGLGRSPQKLKNF